MTFETITGAAASTATTFGGATINKITNWLNGAGSEVATIFDDDLFITDPVMQPKESDLMQVIYPHQLMLYVQSNQIVLSILGMCRDT
jgi:hypothetical protein